MLLLSHRPLSYGNVEQIFAGKVPYFPNFAPFKFYSDYFKKMRLFSTSSVHNFETKYWESVT